MLGRVLTMACGRRSKWLFLVAWVVIFAAVSGPASKFEDAQKNEPSSFSPGSAESLKANEADEGLSLGEQLTAIVVFRRRLGPHGRRPRPDRAPSRARLNADLPKTATPAPPPVISRDRTTALLVMQVRPHGESKLLTDAANRIKDVSYEAAKDGLQVKLTGPLGFSADAVDVFTRSTARCCWPRWRSSSCC